MTEGPTTGPSHALCLRCWKAREGPFRLPHVLAPDERQKETCCSCGEPTVDGIYQRKPVGTFQRCAHSERMSLLE